MPNITLAFDRETVRRIDDDGRLHVAQSHISKAAVNPYYGSEIPGFEELGLVADKIYQMLRDPVELEKGAHTFKNLPLLSEHVPVTVDSPRPDLVVGSIGSDVVFNYPYLDADICVWDKSAIAGIETDQLRELSCAYRYVPVMEPGEFEGMPYDGRMTDIRGNHLALVSVGRAGSDVVVADEKPTFKIEDAAMKMTKLGTALVTALSAACPKLAADALPPILGQVTRKNFNKAAVRAKLLALDGMMEPEQMDNVIDALLDVEQSPTPVENPTADQSPQDQMAAVMMEAGMSPEMAAQCAAKCMQIAGNGMAGDAYDNDDMVKKSDMQGAMDTMRDDMRREFRDATEARAMVRHVVGDVVAMDSAEQILTFALDHMKVDRAGVTGVAALKALFKVADGKQQSATVALDAAADVTKALPNLARFGRAF